MPIEVRELVIKATVSDKSASQAGEKRLPKKEKDRIIAECVEQVLEALERKKEK